MNGDKRASAQPALIEPEIELFPNFDDTMTTGIDDTMRNLRLLDQGHRQGTTEYENFHLQATRELTAEVSAMRKELAKVVQTVNLKASKGQMHKFEAAMSEHVDKRLDSLRTVCLACLGLGLTALGLFSRLK